MSGAGLPARRTPSTRRPPRPPRFHPPIPRAVSCAAGRRARRDDPAGGGLPGRRATHRAQAAVGAAFPPAHPPGPGWAGRAAGGAVGATALGPAPHSSSSAAQLKRPAAPHGRVPGMLQDRKQPGRGRGASCAPGQATGHSRLLRPLADLSLFACLFCFARLLHCAPCFPLCFSFARRDLGLALPSLLKMRPAHIS